MALQISEWNQARKDYAEETQILIRLKADFEENQIELKKNEANYQEILSDMRSSLVIIETEPDSYLDELIRK
jgi:hypothetical protein